MTEKTLRRYAITGGIGSGKSTVAAMFARLGAVIIDADAISRDLMRPTENTLNAVVAEFGPDILHPDGTLNRPALAALVFSDEDARNRLNNIVHPAVRARADALVEQAWRAPGFSGIIIDDIPLLAAPQSSTASLWYIPAWRNGSAASLRHGAWLKKTRGPVSQPKPRMPNAPPLPLGLSTTTAPQKTHKPKWNASGHS